LAQAREAVRADPYFLAAQYTLGLAAVADRRLDEAEKAFAEAVKLSPQDAAGAVSVAELATNERPADVEAAVLLSQTLRASGDANRAADEVTARLAAGR